MSIITHRRRKSLLALSFAARSTRHLAAAERQQMERNSCEARTYLWVTSASVWRRLAAAAAAAAAAESSWSLSCSS